jgi:Family of unknown function (DUF6279)
MRLKKHLLIVFLSCFIISCSLIKTGYNNAPTLVLWWLDDYFSFSQSQNLALKPSLQKLHNWHRQNQLSSYITQLQDMQTSLAKEQISAAEACQKIDAIKQSIHVLQVESIPIIIEMAPLLSSQQLNRFQSKLQERTKKWKADWWQETKAEQLAIRLEKTEDFAEKMYGDLSDTQLMLLKQRLEQAAINPAISYKEIQRRNEDAFKILSALQNQPLSLEEKSLLVKNGFDRIQKSPNQDYQTYADKLSNHTCETIENLHASTTPKQKLHAKNWLQDYINQINALITTSQ